MSTGKATGIQVDLNRAEKVRKFLSENNLLRVDLKISKDTSFIYFPVNKVSKELDSCIIIEKEFEKKEIKPKSYREIVTVPDNLKHELPVSYNIIGNIILIKLSKNLLIYQKDIGKSLLKTNRNIKTVCLAQPVSGELRTRNMKVIAGKKCTKTTHKEYGLTFKVDVKKTYYRGLGILIDNINGVKRKGDYDWGLFVNGVAPGLPACKVKLKKGDSVDWVYGKMSKGVCFANKKISDFYVPTNQYNRTDFLGLPGLQYN